MILSHPFHPAIFDQVAQQQYPHGALYVVATPIGNLGDITVRALHVLSQVDVIACEDTRKTSQLLHRYGLSVRLIAAHQHNEREVAQNMIARLQAGERIALVSDAGTPSISDPGARIVDAVRSAGLRVLPIPGASAAISALSVSGFVCDQFHFMGFLPSKAAARDKVLRDCLSVSLSAIVVMYESPHRVVDTVGALCAIFGQAREIVIARELTKVFETIHRCSLGQARHWLEDEAKALRQKGEFVLLINAATKPSTSEETTQSLTQDTEAQRVLSILLAALPTKQATSLAAEITGHKKNALYERALLLKNV